MNLFIKENTRSFNAGDLKKDKIEEAERKNGKIAGRRQ